MAMAIATPMAHLLLGTTRAQAFRPAAPLLRPLLHPACQFPPLLLRPRLHSPSLPRLASRRFSSKPQAPLSPTQPPNKEPEPEPGWPNLEPWDVPWDGTTTVAGMLSWLFSFVVTGLVVSVVAAQLGVGRRQGLDLDEQATFILCNQL